MNMATSTDIIRDGEIIKMPPFIRLVSSDDCTKCNTQVERNELHDAYFCGTCDEWKEEKCPDPTCEYCTTRPEKPSAVKKKEQEAK